MARTLTVITRSLGSYYQRNDSGPPVAPDLNDPSVDIDKNTKEIQLKYLANVTDETNKIPISRTYPQSNVEYGTNFQAIASQDSEQFRYAPQLDPTVAPSYRVTNWFPADFSTPDPIGVYNKDGRVSKRSFAIQQYMTRVAFEDTPSPTAPIDNALLNAIGYNEANKFIPQNVQTVDRNPVNGPDYRRTLGSTGFQSLGVYAKSTHVGQQGNNTPKNTRLEISDLEKVGLNLLFDAVQGDAGLDFKIESESDFTEAEARMTLPSLPRIGKKTSLNRFTAATTLKKLKNDQYNKSGVTNFYDNTNDVQTNGSFYSPYNQFDSLVSVGQIALAIAMILAFVLLLDLIVLLIPNRPPTNEQITRTEGNLRFLGTSKIEGNNGGYYPDNKLSGVDVLTQILGVNGLFSPNYHTFDDCLEAGIAEFFGFSFGSSGIALSSFASTSLKILLESGRMTTILREILRSGMSVVEGGIADFAGGFSISALGKLIRKIRDLKIIKFIDVLQQIGDKILFENDLAKETKVNSPNTISGSNVSYVDSLSDDRTNYIAKSRLSDGKIAWGTSTAGILSLPVFQNGNFINLAIALSSSMDSDNLYGNANIGGALGPDDNPYYNLTEWGYGRSQAGSKRDLAVRQGRIPSDVVKKYEDQLEADYMPFYIHDLRTNEILPFHAFLEDVGEDFNIDYSTVEGYGRMDKVHIHKSTTRNISVTFTMIATDAEDHAIMWYKINKLATVIYPQWTQGRQIKIGNGDNALSFIQPFSQIPGATPVIRLRLGDLWKSNYSKMAVARLFGATTMPDYNVEVTPPATPPRPTATTTPASPPTPPSPPQQQRSRNGGHRRPNGNYRIGDHVIINYDTPFDSQPLVNGLLRQQINPGPNIKLKAKILRIRDNYQEPSWGGVSKGYDLLLEQVFYLSSPLHRPERGEPVGVLTEASQYDGNFDLGAETDPIGQRRVNQKILTLSSFALARRLDVARTSRLLNRANESARNGRNQQQRTAATTTGATPPSPAGQPSPTEAAANTETTPSESATPDMTSGLVTMTTADFYDENKNPIMKSFKASGGEGLAGVVTQFKIDMKGKDGRWGIDGSEGLRAPIMVSISLTLAVIHDIVPGLDANGIMNAPIWPVGRHSNFFKNEENDRYPDPYVSYQTGKNYFNRNFIRRR